MQSQHSDWITPQAQSPLSCQLSAVVTLSARRLFGNSKNTHGCLCLHVIFLTVYGNMELSFFSLNKKSNKTKLSGFQPDWHHKCWLRIHRIAENQQQPYVCKQWTPSFSAGEESCVYPHWRLSLSEFWGYTPEEQAARRKKTITEKLSASIKAVSWQRPWLIAHHIMANYRRSRATLTLIIR